MIKPKQDVSAETVWLTEMYIGNSNSAPTGGVSKNHAGTVVQKEMIV